MKADLEHLLQDHFKEDKRDFTLLKENDARTEELLKINGEHMSYIRKDMSEIAVAVKDLAEAQRTLGEKQAEHIKEVAPVIKAFQDNLVFKNKLAEKGALVVKVVGGASMVVGALWAVKNFVIEAIASAIKHL